ncbi:MAG: hypothetical protein ABI828_04965 [Actinomycetota bacterium]
MGLYRSDVTLPEDVQRRIDVWRGIGGLLLVTLYAWDAWKWNETFLPIHLMNTAIHESGHALFGIVSGHNERITLIMGNGWETLFPCVIGIWFLVRKKNWVAFGVCMAWVANTLVDAAIYIYDAPRGALPLVGLGSWSDAGTAQLGDWARILGPEHYDKLFLADPIARDVRHVAVLCILVAFGAVVTGSALNQRRLHELDRGREPVGPTLHVQRRAPLSDVAPEEMWR